MCFSTNMLSIKSALFNNLKIEVLGMSIHIAGAPSLLGR